MKQVIDGKIYNTETAHAIADHDNGRPLSDFNSACETLYRTTRGRWFLHGKGGAMTRWRSSSGDMWAGGEGILPITEAEAIAWCEEHNINADVIVQFFAVDEA